MRASTISAIAAAIVALAVVASGPAAAGRDENPGGFGLYSPDPQRSAYRYDPRSWYYRQPGYYPYYASSYWVPRAEMRYRYRYQYYGPKYRYYPAWGYPRPGHNGGGDSHWHWRW
ncbi:MAG: hypothetical protein K2X43_04405 [Hyphomonadaceae bacterium]|jgi:hypothetical protein|nr:hypothetical protein [Hyphomonadaceae bacterium]